MRHLLHSLGAVARMEEGQEAGALPGLGAALDELPGPFAFPADVDAVAARLQPPSVPPRGGSFPCRPLHTRGDGFMNAFEEIVRCCKSFRPTCTCRFPLKRSGEKQS